MGSAGQALAGTRGAEKLRSRLRGPAGVNPLLGFLSQPSPASPSRPGPSSGRPWAVGLVFLLISQFHSFSSDLSCVTSLKVCLLKCHFLMSRSCSKTSLLPPFLSYSAGLDFQGNKITILHSTPSTHWQQNFHTLLRCLILETILSSPRPQSWSRIFLKAKSVHTLGPKPCSLTCLFFSACPFPS